MSSSKRKAKTLKKNKENPSKKKESSSTEDSGQAGSASVFEDCSICCNEYENQPNNWTILECSHKVCTVCYKEIKKSRSTMSGIQHSFVKCPFCLGVSGIEIGTCPNGDMAVDIIRSYCVGYEAYNSIRISYNVNHPRYHLHRVAYLPNNDEGNAALQLLKIAWDRRVSFTIGTSVTTGQENALVWNIHHKTSQSGGTECYGYPDPEYFQRLKLELSQFGIE